MKSRKIAKILVSILILLMTIVISYICYGAEEITSNEYKLTQVEGTNCILGIYQNTRAKVLKQNMSAESTINIYDKTGTNIGDNELVKTGDTIKIGSQNYTAIVCGDINGDGNVTITDLSKIKSHLVGLNEQVGAGKIASDIDINGKITSTDMLNIKRLIVRIIEEREIFERKYTGTEYEYKKNTLTDKITITSIIDNKTSQTLQIPDKIDGNEVKQIEGFLGESSKVKTVIIPSGIESIGRTSFSGLTNLEAIEVSKLNEKYSSEDGILYDKEQEEIVYYPRGKQETQITIKETVSKIGEYAFYKNNKIEKLYIPDTIAEIAKNSFEEMKGKVYVKEDSNIISKLKAQGISYEIDAKPIITKLTSTKGTNQKITLNIEATDDVGIVAWGIIEKGETNITWQNVNITNKLEITYEGITQNGTYEINAKDNVGNIGTKEILINEVDSEVPQLVSIKVISPTSGEYKPGQRIIVRAEFSEKIKGTAPELKLKIGSNIGSGTVVADNPTGTQNYIDYIYTSNDKETGKIDIYSYTGENVTDLSGNKASIIKLANSGNNVTIVPNTTLEIHYLNLGRVDGILFVCDGEYAFMDSGFESDGVDSVTYLKKLGIKKLKYLIASHPHHNHIDGFIPIVNYATVERAYFSRYAHQLSSDSTNHYTKVTNYLKQKGIPISTMDVGDTLKLGKAVIRCFGAKNTTNINDSSLVFTISLGNHSFMFTGDIGIGTEVTLAKTWGSQLKSTILKAPHHHQAIDSRFINAVNPEYIVVCSNKASLNGSSYGKKVYFTANGTIVVSTDGQNLTIKQ